MILQKSKAKYAFDMPSLRRRIKTRMRKKHKRKIKLNEVDKIWKAYVEEGIVKPVLKYGKVQVDKNFSIEIVGQRIVENKKMFSILSRGIGMTKNGYMRESANLNQGRDGLFYKIEVVDKNFKGKLYFDADAKIKKRVHEELKNTNTYYRVI